MLVRVRINIYVQSPVNLLQIWPVDDDAEPPLVLSRGYAGCLGTPPIHSRDSWSCFVVLLDNNYRLSVVTCKECEAANVPLSQ